MKSTGSNFVFDPQRLRQFDVNGPRYTSYPTADRFDERFNADRYQQYLEQRGGARVGGGGASQNALSLYVHLPFCPSVCYYCACNKVITKDHSRSARYLHYVAKEIAMQRELLTGSDEVVQLHWGGGTPTFLSSSEMRFLMAAIRGHFQLLADGEYSIEVDPRGVDAARVELLAELGFNRMSIGVQDFDERVQRAVHRLQSESETAQLIQVARAAGFKSVSLDLIYGLPHQSVESFTRTVERVLEMAPDRVSIYNYAHLPHVFKTQRRIVEADLPNVETRIEILAQAIHSMTAAGYVYIGMDHFAKPDDELAIAQRQGRLHRNFQGYSTHADCDLLAFGISAIGKLGWSYVQNVKTLEEYYARLERGHLPVYRGIELNADDVLRRSVIQALMCHFELSIESIELAHLIRFREYFAPELSRLEVMQAAGLLRIDDQWLSVLPAGRFLIRVIAMVFDRYLSANQPRASYSKVV